MRKSLAMIGLFALMFYMMATVLLPFANPWFFLLAVPMIPMLPHLDKISDRIFKILDE